MRLIDADEFKCYIERGFEETKGMFKTEKGRELAEATTKAFLQDIDEQPTAYDMDKVVEQFNNRRYRSEVVYIDEAIEIVKEGRIDEQKEES